MELTDFLITFLSQLFLLLIGWHLAKRTDIEEIVKPEVYSYAMELIQNKIF